MDPIYVTGHRNPDTDSIVAAMAYAALRNACGNREYEAACLGHLSDETQTVLDRFGFQPPKRISNMYTQVQDLDFDQPPILSAAVTEDRAWKLLQEQKTVSALPVVNEDGTLYGMLSREDVASYNMELVSTGFLESVPLFNVLSVLEGKILNDAGETAAVKTVFGPHAYQLAMSSTKSMTGHMLGAAGAVEAIFTALSLRDGFLPATIHYQTPDPACDLDVVPNEGRPADIRYALSNSLGFGGHNGSLLLKKWED